jgi:hypothetical protein
LLVDDTRIRIGSSEKVLYVAFEPYLRRIVYMMVLILQHININNSLRGLKLFTAQNNYID